MKKIISLLLCLMLLPVLSVQADTPLVMDFAGLMDSQQELDLESTAATFRDSHGLDVAILTIGTTTGSSSPEAFADDFFDMNYGTDGVLLLLDMGSRSWHISTLGVAAELLSDQDLMDLEDAVIPMFSSGLYYDGFQLFLQMLPRLLKPEAEASMAAFLLICAIPGAILAGIILALMASSMNTKKSQRSACDYTVHGSWHLRTHQDLFLYSNVTKRAKPKNTGKTGTRGSGTTTHTSSSGRRHGGRGGKF